MINQEENNQVKTKAPKEIVVYRLGNRWNGSMSAQSVLDAHYFHAKNCSDKVLFTVETQNVTKIGIGRKPDQIILTLGNFSDGFIANIDDFGEFHSKKPNFAYQNPSQFDTYKEILTNHTWFALSDPQRITNSDLAQFKNVNTGKPLTVSLSGQSCRIYVL
ncbi:TPA: hypothetical protein ACGOZT_001429 [Streptococcus suis]